MSRVDRSALPRQGADPPFRFPRVVKERLGNGLEVRAVSHRGVPVASMTLLVPGGTSVDPADRAGLVSLVAALVDEGSRGQSAEEIADRLARIGGDFDVEAGPDAIGLSLTTLDRCLESGLALLHEMAAEPTLAEGDIERVRGLRIERLRQLRVHAAAVADRAFASTVYGAHAYGRASLGTEASLAAVAASDVVSMHAALVRPEGATLVVAGDRGEEELVVLAERAFGAWRPSKTAAVDRQAALAPPPGRPETSLAVVARPGAAQSELRIGRACAARSTPDYHALVVLNQVLGGQFVSRVNLNLREQKGYTYGVRTGFDLRRGIGPFVLQTSVATEVTADAVREALREIADIGSARPATADEVALAQASVARGFPRGFETAVQVVRSTAQLALHGLPDGYFEEFVPRLMAVTPGQVTEAARRHLDPGRMATIVAGDLDRIGGSLDHLGLGPPTPVWPAF